MSILKRNSSRIESSIVEALVNGTTLTNFRDGSRLRSFVSAISLEMGLAYDAVQFSATQSRLDTAGGMYLDATARDFGIVRFAPSKAFATAEDRNVKIYVASGSLITVLTSGQVPSGTVLSTGDGTITYTVSSTVRFDSVVDHVFVPVVASVTGSAQNVGVGQLNTTTLSGSVSVTNLKVIDNGRDSEDDTSFRARARAAPALNRSGNLQALTATALSLAGVADVRLREAPEGPGTIEFLVIPASNDVPESTVVSLRSAAAQIKASGIKILVRTPTLIPIQVVAEVSTKPVTTRNDRETIRRNTEQAVLNYLGQLTFGATLVLNELHERIQGASEQIFDHKLICVIVDGAEHLMRNITLGDDELFVPDPAAADRAVEILMV